MDRLPLAALLLCAAALAAGAAWAAEPDVPEPAADEVTEERSPWIALPTLSSNPKLGTAIGALGGYLHQFDDESRISIFGVGLQYTSTDSKVAAAIARTSWGADHHRLTAIAAAGLIRNDYDDYLGTGIPLRTDDDLHALFTRYLYRISGDWFVGGQLVITDYQVLGYSDFDDMLLEALGVKGFDSNGIGPVVMHDSRDNQDMPEKGWMMNLNQVAYREDLGGSDDFDVYRLDLRWFTPHGDRAVLAVRNLNQHTRGAPLAANATIQLRGFKPGEYLGQNMTSLEVEERFRLGERWGWNAFVGIACLYGNTGDCGRETYTGWGVGLQFIIKPEQKMLANLELAQAEGGRYTAILKLGYAW